MARPQKYTVDYFSHKVNHGKTLFILKDKYGNDGYAFWFQLLEILGKTEGHIYDCGDQSGWKYLLAYTSVDNKMALEILNDLGELNAIDPDLWKKKKVWCQNLVDSLGEVYKRRKINKPQKPNPDTETTLGGVNANINPDQRDNSGINVDINSQRREEYSKEEKSIVKKEEEKRRREPPTMKPSTLFISIVKGFKEFNIQEDKDEKWFVDNIENNPEYKELNVVKELTKWWDWLDIEHRKKLSRRPNKFPKSNFKNAVHNWMDNEIIYQKEKKDAKGFGSSDRTRNQRRSEPCPNDEFDHGLSKTWSV